MTSLTNIITRSFLVNTTNVYDKEYSNDNGNNSLDIMEISLIILFGALAGFSFIGLIRCFCLKR